MKKENKKKREQKKKKKKERPELTIGKDEDVIEKGIAMYTTPRQMVPVCVLHQARMCEEEDALQCVSTLDRLPYMPAMYV